MCWVQEGNNTIQNSLQMTYRHNLLPFQGRYCDERCQKADWGRHGDYCVKVQEKIRKKMEAKKVEKGKETIRTSEQSEVELFPKSAC